MPDAVAADGAAGEEQPQGSSWEQKAWSIGKQIAFFFLIQFAIRQFMGGGGSKQATPVPQKDPVAADGSQPPPIVDYSIVPRHVFPLWPANTTLDISMYISPSLAMPPFSKMPADSLIVHETGFSMEKSKKDVRDIHTSFSVPKTVQDNSTLFGHIFVGKHGAQLDPSSPDYDVRQAYRMIRPLTQYLPRKKVKKMRNLLETKNETEALEVEAEETGASVASYYHPNFTLAFVPDAAGIEWAPMPLAVKQYYSLDALNERDDTGTNGFFYPIIYHNTFWQLKSHMVELNSTVPFERLDMNVRLSTLAGWQFTIMATMDENMRETARRAAAGESTPGGGDGSEMELIKETLLDTNPWLLGTTVVVTVLHMIFEMLAFKSDVGHWRKKKDNVGVSVRTILSNVFMQLIIFLYLIDNNDRTSWMILFGQGVGIAIEAWKVTKAVNVRVRPPGEGSWFHGYLPYVVVFEDKHVLSETEEKTEEYDKIAFYYMGIGAVPLLLAYAVYSLIYESHKSWYSFIITTLVGSVYAYGFLMMVRLPSSAPHQATTDPSS